MEEKLRLYLSEASLTLFLNCSRLDLEATLLLELEEDLRLCFLAVEGSTWDFPSRLAKRERISVIETTPINFPGRPISFSGVNIDRLLLLLLLIPLRDDEGDRGILDPAIIGSSTPTGLTIHNRCDFVATSFAIVLDNEEFGVTWKIGKESLPFSKPLRFRM